MDGGFPISDGEGGERPVRPADIVILLRSPNTVLHHYARALGERDIPWEAEGGGDFFAATEVNVALSLLQIVDNPRQDVPLISVLRSPVYGFSADRLAELRAASPDTDFYAALTADGGEDSRAFLTELDELRFGAGELSSHELLWQLYDRTNLLGVFGAMDGGRSGSANLLTLAELARRFEGAGHKGLFGFLSYLTRLRENGASWPCPPPAGRGGRRAHPEHPQVEGAGVPRGAPLRAGAEAQPGGHEPAHPVPPQAGGGPQGLDVERGMEYPTLARRAVARKLELEMMAEELRLLYVAMTRAKEKLILSVALTGGARDLEKLAPDAACPVEPQVLAGCQSVGQWVLLHALARPEASALRSMAGLPEVSPGTLARLGYSMGRWGGTGPDSGAEGPLRGSARRVGDGTGGAERGAGLALSVLPFPPRPALQAHRHPAQGAERWTRTREAADGGGPAPPAHPPGAAPVRRRGVRPHPGPEGHRPLPGHAVHRLRADGARGAGAGRDRPAGGAGLPHPPAGGGGGPGQNRGLFSPLPWAGRWPRPPVPPGIQIFPSWFRRRTTTPMAGAEEQVLLQGVVDCCFETLEGITVVDFKTDRVDRRSVAARAEEYRPQLEAYSRALEEITGKPVIRRCLWFFALDQAVDV